MLSAVIAVHTSRRRWSNVTRMTPRSGVDSKLWSHQLAHAVSPLVTFL